jgi:uncharacterized protein with FMN-binding domain
VRRIVTFLAGTVTAVVLLFGYHTSTAGSLLATPEVASVTGPAAAATSGHAATGGSSAGGAAGGASGDVAGTRTVTGPTVPTEWGPVQVRLTLSGDRITDVAVLQHPSGNPRDEAINGYALPILVQSTLDAQSDRIDMVSGATVTSLGYLQSLQAALDEAGS